ncbi:MAG: RagB/SusD family nutrient uptake outer membrane protein [Gemmatimonadetes bacterium]|nr:RagB/SusD family nutrient uptake outer membrane protein [Gemmatimonadota bacterium]
MSMKTLRGLWLLLPLLLSVPACSLLDVEIPGRVPVSELDNPALSATMVSAAMGELECALSVYVVSTAILNGEVIVSGLTINSNIWGWRGDVELRGVGGNCGANYGFYNALQRARFLADDGFKRIDAFPDAEVAGKALMLAQLRAYGGYAYTLLGEGFCQMCIDEGPLMTRAQVWQQAESRFSDAITRAAALTGAEAVAMLNMARVGRARVRLNLGNTAGADADAALVPLGYVRNATHSATVARRYNRVYEQSIGTRDVSVAPAFRGLTVGAVPVADTRVRAVDALRNGQDGVTRQWDQQKYLSRTAATPIATYVEAQLILAEIRGGAQAITILNSLRTGATPALPVLTPAEQASIAATVVEERRRWLFLEGHRINDMLRFAIPFATGVNHKGQTYGSVTCMPLPDVEILNNPNI